MLVCYERKEGTEVEKAYDLDSAASECKEENSLDIQIYPPLDTLLVIF